jgi:hypothetical protein
MIRSRFNRKLNVLEVKYSGKLRADELKAFGDSLCLNRRIPRELKILTDVREGEYDFTERELPGVIESLRRQLKAFKYIKAAFIQTRPHETAISMITERRTNIPNYFHRVFSTPEAAMIWLLDSNNN